MCGGEPVEIIDLCSGSGGAFRSCCTLDELCQEIPGNLG